MNAIPAITCRHAEAFNTGNPVSERNTKYAVILTAITMVIEIVCGYMFNSMALLADGWHMSSHVLALGLALLAYVFARRYASDSRFAFGTWKIEILGSYTSALLLVLVAGLMVFHSIERLIEPTPILYNQAIAIACLGLTVNLACAWLLRGGHGHGHAHSHSHDHSHGDEDHHHHSHHDLNLRSAYIHVITDAATSVLAIVALFGGKIWGANWLDPTMGLVGAALVSIWAYGLLRQTSRVLLDAEMNAPVVDEIRQAVADAPVDARIEDLHVWRVGGRKYACILVLGTSENVSPDYFRQLLSIHEELVHVTVEINHSTESEKRASTASA